MKKFLTLAIALIMALTMVSASAATYTVGLSMDDLNTEFWQGNYKAIYEKAAELDVEIVEAIAGGDANTQNEQIADMIAKGVKVIIIAPKDSSAIEAAIQECQDAGVKTIMDNRNTAGNVAADAAVLSDNEQMAYDEMTWLINYAKAQNVTFDNAIMLIGRASCRERV